MVGLHIFLGGLVSFWVVWVVFSWFGWIRILETTLREAFWIMSYWKALH